MNQTNRLRNIFLNHGHIFVSGAGYVSIEIYSANTTVCDYVAQMLGGVVKPHLSIKKVAIHNRPSLVLASQKLLELVFDDDAEAQLRLVLEYASAESKEKRDDAVDELRKLKLELEE